MSARITISVPEELAASLTREARKRGASVSSFVRSAIEAYLRDEGSKPLPFVGIGRSGKKHTARDAEEILKREWGDAGDR